MLVSCSCLRWASNVSTLEATCSSNIKSLLLLQLRSSRGLQHARALRTSSNVPPATGEPSRPAQILLCGVSGMCRKRWYQKRASAAAVQADLHDGALKPLLPVCHLLFSSLHSILHLLPCHTCSAWGRRAYRLELARVLASRHMHPTGLPITPAMQADMHIL